MKRLVLIGFFLVSCIALTSNAYGSTEYASDGVEFVDDHNFSHDVIASVEMNVVFNYEAEEAFIVANDFMLPSFFSFDFYVGSELFGLPAMVGVESVSPYDYRTARDGLRSLSV